MEMPPQSALDSAVCPPGPPASLAVCLAPLSSLSTLGSMWHSFPLGDRSSELVLEIRDQTAASDFSEPYLLLTTFLNVPHIP